MLDLGANIECDANNLVQFAVMGAAFARTGLQIERPRVGLLNVGEEELKGNDTVRLAAQILKSIDLPMEFHGFIEGNQIMDGTVDVVVTDGFTGNVALKTAEGSAKLYTYYIREGFRRSLRAKLGYFLARKSLAETRAKFDPGKHNGGVFLGLNGISVKSHGASDATGFAIAIDVAADMVTDNLKQRIIDDFKRFGGIQEQPVRAITR